MESYGVLVTVQVDNLSTIHSCFAQQYKFINQRKALGYVIIHSFFCVHLNT